MTEPITYRFDAVAQCDMCGAERWQFRNLGLRLNRSQGFNPRAAIGIAVSVRQCRRCGLIFADPQPIPSSFSDHYDEPDEYWNADYFEDEPGYFEAEIATAKRLLHFHPGMRALDVGAGIGKAMHALTAAGFEVWGFEPSPAFRKLAVERSGIPEERIGLCTIENATYGTEEFDLISFGAVLEHLRSPSHALRRAMEWLKPGGIVQLEVPSARWLIARLVNLYYRLLGTSFVTNISPMHRPFHLFEFTPACFELNGQHTGYEVVEQRTMVCSIRHAPPFLHGPLRSLMAQTETGMQLSVYLRKTEPATRNRPTILSVRHNH